ncbi:MAG: response regulator [Promethearchaeota archaeon]|nr:MAG: response regulator [Candidatus Lokiarchaeota archaeon]
MKPLIFIVEDDKKILYNMKLMMEYNGYNTLTAKNGVEALEIISTCENYPDIILCDIVMPKMNGYDFFKDISKNEELNNIPFIFISARSAPEDVRFGKMLGADDYITKPFEEEDLLAIVKGKLARYRKIDLINEQIEQYILKTGIDKTLVPVDEKLNPFTFICVWWDDIMGPVIKSYYSEHNNLSSSLNTIGQQLFQSIVAITGKNELKEPAGLLLNIENIKRQGYVFFDSFKDENLRGNEQQFMLAVIAKRVNYFESLKIKEIFLEMSHKIKEEKKCDIGTYSNDLSKILAQI